jgi:mono/diheme cytochrome c family protein
VLADIDDTTYDASSQRTSAAKRRAMDADFARQRQREEERERFAREAEDRAEAERQPALAARPYPVRLLEQRCTACHAAGHYMEQSHTLPGWWFVVLRMKVLNAAELDGAEMSVLANHLTRIRPASGAEAALEYAALPLLLTLPLAAGWGWRRTRRQR